MRVSNEDAIRLYEKLGFESRGIRRGYYTDNREDALIMWRDRRPFRFAEWLVERDGLPPLLYQRNDCAGSLLADKPSGNPRPPLMHIRRDRQHAVSIQPTARRYCNESAPIHAT